MHFGQSKFSRNLQKVPPRASSRCIRSGQNQRRCVTQLGSFAFLLIMLPAASSCTKAPRELNIAQLEMEFNDTKVSVEAKTTHLLSALAYSQATFGPESKKTRSLLIMLAQDFSLQRDFRAAHEYWRRAMMLCDESDKTEIEIKIKCLSGLIASECAQGKCEDATGSYRELLRMRTSLYGAEANQTLTTKKLLAETLQKKKQFSEASTLYEQAIKECPPQNQLFMNSAKLALARCYAKSGRTKEAADIFDELIASAKRNNCGQQNPLLSESLKAAIQLSLDQKQSKKFQELKSELMLQGHQKQ